MVSNVSQKFFGLTFQEIRLRLFNTWKKSFSLLEISFLVKPDLTETESGVVVERIAIKNLIALIDPV